MIKKDQSTSTCCDEVLEVLSGDSPHVQTVTDTASVISTHNGSIITNGNVAAIAAEDNSLELNSDTKDLTRVLKTTEHIEVPASVTDSLFFYTQPVAILHTPALFHLEEQSERSKSATLPRAGTLNIGTTEPLGKDSFTQSNGTTQNQAAGTELSEVSQDAPRAHFSLPESVSAPGTLTNIVVSSQSMHAMAAHSVNPSLQPPRAWFVSLEGKPAAEIHYAVSEEQRRRRPTESRETSLDSGVDMSELNQTPGRRVTLERNVTFVKSSKNVPRS